MKKRFVVLGIKMKQITAGICCRCGLFFRWCRQKLFLPVASAIFAPSREGVRGRISRRDMFFERISPDKNIDEK